MEENINQAIKDALENAPERKFVESVDIAFTIKDVDLKNPNNRIKEEVRLPSGRGKELKIAMFAAGEAATKAKDAGIHVITPQEIEELGGMTKAVKAGIPKLKIEESATKKQAKVESGSRVVVGVNKYKNPKEPSVDVRVIDNNRVRDDQIKKIQAIKKSRDTKAVEKALTNLTDAAKDETNLLIPCIEAIKLRATVGEVSKALEQVYGRHFAKSLSVSGVYGKHFEGDKEFMMVESKIKEFENLNGRRPRVLVVKMGQDGHDRGAKIVATSFADMGFDVDMGPLFQSPKDVAKDAIENDVHAIGVSTLAAGHKTLVPELMKGLKEIDPKSKIIVFVGGIIPEQDYEFLYENNVSAIFGPGSNIIESAEKVIDLISDNLSKE